jgi:hypothetical protein
MNASKLDSKKFSQMADLYREDRDKLKKLLCWNSVDAVVTIASDFGFKLVSKGRPWRPMQGTTVDLLFSKR